MWKKKWLVNHCSACPLHIHPTPWVFCIYMEGAEPGCLAFALHGNKCNHLPIKWRCLVLVEPLLLVDPADLQPSLIFFGVFKKEIAANVIHCAKTRDTNLYSISRLKKNPDCSLSLKLRTTCNKTILPCFRASLSTILL